MQIIDWIVVVLYLIFTMAIGIYLSRKASKSMEDFFVSGRSLTWWLAGTSMAATTFSIDTPLYICGVVASRGIAGNWEWWSFGVAHIVLIYIFARLWRRAEVVTDAELTEIRYGGKMAAVLRATKAFIFAVPINCIGIGYAMLAMVKVVTALELWQSLGLDVGEQGKLYSVIAVSIFVLVYSGFAGLWGVVVTDFFQFFLALFGAIVVATVAVNHVGGIHELVPQVQQATEIDVLSLVPLEKGAGGLFGWRWSDVAGISLSTFSAYLMVQWWSFRRSDGGGEFIQRLISVKDEAEAEKAAWFFNVLNYIIRTWPWILVALASITIYPNLEDPELGYPKLMLDFLPPVILGLVVASLIAAFMSTVSTSINWGASYITNDLYRRFFAPDASQEQLVFAGRVASVLVTFLGAIAAFFASDISTVFRLVIAIGTGPGLVLILRWYWWRINAAAELAAMVGGFLIGCLSLSGLNIFPADFGLKLVFISGFTGIIWITTMLLTAPESPETLNSFYLRVRPAGIGWRKQREETGVEPLQNMRLDILKTIASIFLLFGLMLSIGGFLLLQSSIAWIALIFAVIGGFWLRNLNKQRLLNMSRPGIDR